MKIHRLISALLTTAALMTVNTTAEAQRRPSGVASLGEMACERMQGGSFHVINEDYAIGFEVFTAVAALGTYHMGRYYLDNDRSTQVACRLSGSQQNSQYKTLTLALGIPDTNGHSDRSEVTRLSIYLDGEFYQYQDVVKGETYLMSIDVQNVRSVGLEGSCLSNQSSCAGIYFFEDILE